MPSWTEFCFAHCSLLIAHPRVSVTHGPAVLSFAHCRHRGEVPILGDFLGCRVSGYYCWTQFPYSVHSLQECRESFIVQYMRVMHEP